MEKEKKSDWKSLLVFGIIIVLLYLRRQSGEVEEVAADPLAQDEQTLNTPTKDTTTLKIKGRSGWTLTEGQLRKKRPPRTCSITQLPVQVFDPLIYLGGKDKTWKRRFPGTST